MHKAGSLCFGGAVRYPREARFWLVIPILYGLIQCNIISMGKAKACAVRGCVPVKNKKLRFYSFPTNKILARKWVEKCSRRNNFNEKHAAICQNHFSSAQIRRNLKYELLNLPVPSNWRNLKVDAIPDLNLPFPWTPTGWNRTYSSITR